MTSPDPTNRRDRVPPPPPLRPAPPPMQPASGGSPPPLLPPRDAGPGLPAANPAAPPSRGGNLLVTLLTVAAGGGIVAGVVFALLPKLEPVAQRPGEPEADPPAVYAGSDPLAVSADRDVDAKASATPTTKPTTTPESSRGPRSFAELKAACRAAGHLPPESLDGMNPNPHEAAVCEVGDVAIDLALPTSRLSQHRQVVLMCVPDAAALAAGGQAWDFMAAEPGAEPLRIGGAVVRAGRLFVALEPATQATMLARQAVASAPLRIAARGAADQATFVQLLRPRECGPILVRRLLVGAAAMPGALAEPVEVSLPPCPWPCDVRFHGRCGDLVAATTFSRPGSIAASGTVGSLQWTTAWATEPGVEPFMDVTMALSAIGGWQGRPGSLRVRRVASRVHEPWSNPRRLGRLGGRVPVAGGLPDGAELERQLAGVSIVTLSQMVDASVSRLQLSMPSIMTVARNILREEVPADRVLPLDDWIDLLGGLLAKRPGYRLWAVGHADRQAAGPECVRKYLERLEPAIEAGQADPEEAALACVIDDLDTLRKDKLEAIALVRRLGDGDVAFTGELHADFPDFVPGTRARCVLVRFTDTRDGDRNSVPTP
jgi:hypothetical protein